MSDEIRNALRLAREVGGTAQEGPRAPYGVVDLGDKIIVGSPHGEKIDLSDDLKKRVQDVAAKHGAWYEGTGGDIKPNKNLIKYYRGSWDDRHAESVKGYPIEYLGGMFSNVDVNKPHEKFEDPKRSIMESLIANQEKMKYFKDRRYDEKVLRDFLRQGSQDDVDFESMAQMPATQENLRKFFTTGERLTWPDNWQEYPNKLGKIAKKVEDQRNQFLLNAPPGVYVTGAGHIPELQSLRKDLPVIGGERAGFAESPISREMKFKDGGKVERKPYQPFRGLKITPPAEELSAEPDIREYQLKRHAYEFEGAPEPTAPRRPVVLDAPLFGGKKELGTLPYSYAPAVQKALNLIYGQKTLPLYSNPVTAPVGRALDAYETAKFIQRDPTNIMSYAGAPGTLYGAGKTAIPFIGAGAGAGAVVAEDKPEEKGKSSRSSFRLSSKIIDYPKSDRLPMRFTYGNRHNSKDLKGIGFRGPLKQSDGSVVSEYSSDRDIQYPSVYKGITDRDLATVMAHERISSPKYRGDDEMGERLNAAQPRIPFPEDVDDRAYAAARQRVEAGRSPFYEPGHDPYPQWSPDQTWEQPAIMPKSKKSTYSYGGEIDDALRLARSRFADGGSPAVAATAATGAPAAAPITNTAQQTSAPLTTTSTQAPTNTQTPTTTSTTTPTPSRGKFPGILPVLNSALNLNLPPQLLEFADTIRPHMMGFFKNLMQKYGGPGLDFQGMYNSRNNMNAPAPRPPTQDLYGAGNFGNFASSLMGGTPNHSISDYFNPSMGSPGNSPLMGMFNPERFRNPMMNKQGYASGGSAGSKKKIENQRKAFGGSAFAANIGEVPMNGGMPPYGAAPMAEGGTVEESANPANEQAKQLLAQFDNEHPQLAIQSDTRLHFTPDESDLLDRLHEYMLQEQRARGGEVNTRIDRDPDWDMGLAEGGEVPEPKESRPPVSSEYLPVTADDQGLHLDWNAGIPGKLKRAGEYFYDTMSGQREMDPTSQEAVEAANTIAGAMTLGSGTGSAPAGALRAGISFPEPLFHATPEIFHPSELRPGSHLGTEAAARHIIKNFKEDMFDPGEAPPLRLLDYEYKPAGEIFTAKDNWLGLPAEGAILEQMIKRGIYKPKRSDLPKPLSQMGYADWSRVFPEIAKKKGISTIKYINDIEDAGKPSYIVYDPENLKYLGTYEGKKFADGGAVADALRLAKQGQSPLHESLARKRYEDGGSSEPQLAGEVRAIQAPESSGDLSELPQENAQFLDIGPYQKSMQSSIARNILKAGSDETDKLAKKNWEAEHRQDYLPPTDLQLIKEYEQSGTKVPMDVVGRIPGKGKSTVIDPEGRRGSPLYVAGTKPSGENVPLSSGQTADLARKLSRLYSYKEPSAEKYGGNWEGVTFPGPRRKLPFGMSQSAMGINRALTDDEKLPNIMAHETGHVIHNYLDRYEKPFEGISQKAAKEILKEAQKRLKEHYLPTEKRKSYVFSPQEMFAESVRSYLSDPASFKKSSPETAKYLRSIINTDPRINKLLFLSELQKKKNAATGGTVKEALLLARTQKSHKSS